MPQQNPHNPPDQASELQELRKASDGLTYPSESDAPFDLFRWDREKDRAAATARDAVAAHARAGERVEEVPVDRFFSDLDGTEDADRYRALRRALESSLSDVKVFRVGAGSVEVAVYLVGKTRAGDWAGLHTISVET